MSTTTITPSAPASPTASRRMPRLSTSASHTYHAVVELGGLLWCVQCNQPMDAEARWSAHQVCPARILDFSGR